jgi:putative ABC transport system ATP-binding protein
MLMNVIEMNNITKQFEDGDKQIVLQDINIAIKSGEFVAIMGNSGSGKSTLMNIIGLLDVPSAGTYLLDGKPVATKKENELAKLRRDKIGFVFQSFNLLTRLTLLQNVELPMIYTGVKPKVRRARALELLDIVGIKERAGFKPNRISGGQAQRAAIARALANEPSLLLADEPTGNLDSRSSAAIMSELHSLHEQGVTIVMVTHNPELAEEADRTILLHDGRVVDTPPKKAASKKKVAK